MKKTSRNKNRRAQAVKHNVGRNEEFAMATITRHAAAARPIPSGKAYKRAKAGARGRDW